LKNFFKITSYGNDRDGKEFVATVEGLKYPVFGVQFHPEEMPYNEDLVNEEIFNAESIKISMMLALQFTEEARKNNHTMSESDLSKWLFINSLTDLPQHIDGELMHIFSK